MSNSDYLDTLRRFELEHQYPCLYGSGITSLDRLVQLDPSRVHTLGINGRDDLENLKALILELRASMDMGDDSHYEEEQPTRSSGYQRRRTEFVGFTDSDEEPSTMRGRDAGHDRAGVSTRPGGQTRVPTRRPSSIYNSNGPNSGTPRSSAPSNSFSPPPVQAGHHGSSGQTFGEPRTIGRQGLSANGNTTPSVINRRQTLAPMSSTQGFGFARANDNALASNSMLGNDFGSSVNKAGPAATAHRSRTVSARPGTANPRGTRPNAASVNGILERSNNFAQAQRLAENPDDDLEHVVRKTGQSGLVNTYGIPTRPSTAHARRPANERRSLAPSSTNGPLLRPKVPNRGSKDDGAGGGSGSKEGLSNLNDKIRVCVRKRPLNRKEREKSEKDIVITNGCRSLSVMEPKTKVDMTKYIEESRFLFDEVFDENSDNTQVYERTAKPLVEYIFTGGNATCFAYGQTGSGKTYTMMDVQNGLYIQAADDIFRIMQRPENRHLQVFMLFYEIYMSNLYDLLNERRKIFAREDGNQTVCIQGVREVLIQSPADLMSVFDFGNNCRSTGSTGANSDSSRSHAILQIVLKDTTRKGAIKGKLNFIDLAGNERGADRGDKADKQTIMEGSEINKSLLALKECIRALDLGKKHQPFRQSKLTQVLKDSFIGNSRACMIATISPNSSNSENTLNTLRYSDRVKTMKSAGTAGDSTQAANDGARDADDYYSTEVDADYEDDSANRAYDESLDASYGIQGAGHGYPDSSQSVFREEDEYADDMGIDEDDEFASVATTYHQRRQQQQQPQPQPQPQQNTGRAYEHARRPSFDDRSDYDISNETPAIVDEQPAFLDEARHALRSPRAYGSPAAKSFVTSRMAMSPPTMRQQMPPSKLSGTLVRNKKSVADTQALQQQQQQLQHRSSFEDDDGGIFDSDAGRRTNHTSSRRLVGPPSGGSLAGAGAVGRGMRPPAMSRSNSVSQDPLVSDRDSGFIQVQARQQVLRSNTHSNGTIASADAYSAPVTSTPSPYASAISIHSDDNMPKERKGGMTSNRNSYHGGSEDAVMAEPSENGDASGDGFGGLRIADVEAFVNQHRAEIRVTTEAVKEETMLIAAYAGFTQAHLVQQTRSKAEGTAVRPNNWQQQLQPQNLTDKYFLDVNTGSVTRLADGLRFDSVEQAKMHEAMEYLEKLDEVLAKKQQYVVDLRAAIRKLVWSSADIPN
ncbi:hypothetical protein BX661DRAFT_179671 [Kickxella alabastrina]|uniref:uncharacterized protein n=1 Tax=Kickxella alabastrina TaxID=61397 RepID=UPI002220D4B0|nr:uncharacterized protein BX661DRAFT_179671 [Kickxella alabastrina]KAI7832022.1 hypothetical protein BX661DRAFT_179671 [Kickxella alabastrina]